jgi:hypothetical protein
MKIASSKKTQYNDFSVFVVDHVQNYVVPQYGDFPDK